MTTLNAVVENSLSTIRAIDANIVRLRDEAKAARQNAIQPFLEALAASGEVSLIVVYGYTPGFNDGEPCEHSADHFVNVEQCFREEMFDRGVGLGDLEELGAGLKHERQWNGAKRGYDINLNALQENLDLCKAHGHVWAEPSTEIMTAIRDVIFETAEEENGTDYYVAYILKDGKFEVKSGEYECGY